MIRSRVRAFTLIELLVVIAIIVILAAIACSKPITKVKEKVKDIAEEISAPLGRRDDPAAREKERFDQQWRQLESFRARQAEAERQRQQQAAAAQPPANFRFVTGVKQTFKGLDANGRPIVTPQPPEKPTFPGPLGATNWYSPSYSPGLM